MTMPSKMTEYPEKRRITWIDDETNERVGQCEYIRADIAEELARALEASIDDPDSWRVYQAAKDAVSKYREINP